MIRAGLVAVAGLTATVATAEMRDEEHWVADALVEITVVDTLEIMTVGPNANVRTQVLSGADVEIVAFAGDADSVALLGQPVLVAEVTGTHSCEAGDARDYWVVTLGDVPAPEGPVTTCEAMAVSVTASGQVLLEGEDEALAWAPGKGWSVPSN